MSKCVNKHPLLTSGEFSWNKVLLLTAICLSALTLLVLWQEGHLACRKLSGGLLADLHMAQLMPLPLSLAPVNLDWFYLSGTGLPG